MAKAKTKARAKSRPKADPHPTWNTDTLTVRMDKGDIAELVDRASILGMTTNAFVKNLLKAELKRPPF